MLMMIIALLMVIIGCMGCLCSGAIGYFAGYLIHKNTANTEARYKKIQEMDHEI